MKTQSIHPFNMYRLDVCHAKEIQELMLKSPVVFFDLPVFGETHLIDIRGISVHPFLALAILENHADGVIAAFDGDTRNPDIIISGPLGWHFCAAYCAPFLVPSTEPVMSFCMRFCPVPTLTYPEHASSIYLQQFHRWVGNTTLRTQSMSYSDLLAGPRAGRTKKCAWW